MTKVTHLPADDRSCGWYHLSPPRRPKPAHYGRSAARWVVVGAGFTGLAAARQLALHFPDEEIVLVEAQEVGFGTAGRNAGFAIDLPHDIGADDYIGDIATARIGLKLNLAGQSLLREQVQRHAIDCQMKACGKYQAAVEARGVAVLDAYRRGLDRLGQAYEVIEADDLPGHIGTAFYRKALFTPVPCWCSPRPWSGPGRQPAGQRQPLRTHTDHRRGIWRQDPAEPSPRQHPGRPPGPRQQRLRHELQLPPGRMLPIFTYASLTRPLDAEEQARLGGRPYWGLIPADPYGTTVRRTPDNRLLIRNSFSFNPDGRSAGSTLSASPYAIAPRSASASRCSRKSASTTPGRLAGAVEEPHGALRRAGAQRLWRPVLQRPG